ncbi:MAG: MFS transporter [Microbacteriaceae bacterium]|uniref:MFS transporter n=1 Tax=Brevibacterium sp. FAM 27836 TaxID=3446693 RepID=UPI003F518E9E
MTTTSKPGTRGHKSQVGLVLATVFLAYLGQMTLNPVIAPLSREVGLAEWQVGLMISVAAIMVVLTSQSWGRRSQSWGRKPVLAAAMLTATVAMILFAFLSALGMQGILTGTAIFVLFVLTRGLLFGTALAAMAPTAQAYIADVTDTEEERVRGMAGVGAVQGVAMVAGAVVGGLLAGIGLIVSIGAVPVLLLLGLLIVTVALRRETRTELIPHPPRISPFDTRVWPFLLAGFGMFTALGFIQVVTGFLVQDRFALDANTTGLVTGAALLAAGIGMVFAQAVIVPRSRWRPATLLRTGTLTGTLGFLALLFDAGIPLLIIAIALIGLGIGLAVPGYTAGPTLLMNREEQGGLAGLIGATNGLTFVIAPTASTALYAVWPLLPVIVGAVIMAVVLGFVLLQSRFRKLPDHPKRQEEGVPARTD